MADFVCTFHSTLGRLLQSPASAAAAAAGGTGNWPFDGRKNGLLLTVSSRLRNLPTVQTRDGYQAGSIQVTLDNNAQSPIQVDPAFFSLEARDGRKIGYAPELTLAVAGDAALKKVPLQPGYRAVGLLLFEVKPEVRVSYLIFDDGNGHLMRIKFQGEKNQAISVPEKPFQL